jgi:hypothetical protein
MVAAAPALTPGCELLTAVVLWGASTLPAPWSDAQALIASRIAQVVVAVIRALRGANDLNVMFVSWPGAVSK